MDSTSSENLRLIAFEMWDHKCKILHNNSLSNKVKDLGNIDRSIISILRISTIELLPHDIRLFYVTEASIFVQTSKFQQEWQVKANTIYQTHLKQLANPLSHRKERMVMYRWLKVIPCPTCVTPHNLPTRHKERKEQKQNKIYNQITPSTVD